MRGNKREHMTSRNSLLESPLNPLSNFPISNELESFSFSDAYTYRVKHPTTLNNRLPGIFLKMLIYLMVSISFKLFQISQIIHIHYNSFIFHIKRSSSTFALIKFGGSSFENERNTFI